MLKDDFIDIYKKMVESDGIALLTPVYWHDLAEPMIALMDRVRRCEYAYNHFLKEKSGLLIACAGGTGYGATRCLDRMEEGMLFHLEMKTFDRIQVTRFNLDWAMRRTGTKPIHHLDTQLI